MQYSGAFSMAYDFDQVLLAKLLSEADTPILSVARGKESTSSLPKAPTI